MFKIHCQFEFPLNSKQNFADEWLRINRSRPVLILQKASRVQWQEEAKMWRAMGKISINNTMKAITKFKKSLRFLQRILFNWMSLYNVIVNCKGGDLGSDRSGGSQWKDGEDFRGLSRERGHYESCHELWKGYKNTYLTEFNWHCSRGKDVRMVLKLGPRNRWWDIWHEWRGGGWQWWWSMSRTNHV